jgi:transcriptional regulator with XRE-family HTH domain
LLLSQWREHDGRTQREIANELDMDASRYGAYENARERPGLDHAVALEKLTNGRVKAADWAVDHDGAAVR